MSTQKTFSLADFSELDFHQIAGFPNCTQMSVMPVVRISGNLMPPMGTCFAISNHGLVLTARHVIDEALGITDEAPDGDGSWVGVLYAAEKEEGDENAADLNGGIIPVNTVHRVGDLDIVVMHLGLPVRRETGKFIRMPAHRLSPGIPEKGSMCFGLGYHSMKWQQDQDNTSISQSYSATRGTIEEIHFPKRDISSLHFPCFRTSARFDHGMSGGPVMGLNGNVIGVICSSFNDPEQQGYISYASMLGPALCMVVEALGKDGCKEKSFLHDFVEGGSVLLDDTVSQITVSRGLSKISVNFKGWGSFNNKL